MPQRLKRGRINFIKPGFNFYFLKAREEISYQKQRNNWTWIRTEIG